jgi:hypothetical protein
MRVIVLFLNDYDYLLEAFLPNRELRLSCVSFKDLNRYILCMMSLDLERKDRYYWIRPGRALLPILSNYQAFVRKRQSSVDWDSSFIFSPTIKLYGFPFSLDSKGLDSAEIFYSSCKKHYVVLAERKTGTDVGNRERVMVVFDRYSDAIALIRGYSDSGLKELLGRDFVVVNGWYPYVWVEYMGNPICLFFELSVFSGTYNLGRHWSRYFVGLLRDGYIEGVSFASPFSFFTSACEREFSRVIWYDKQVKAVGGA